MSPICLTHFSAILCIRITLWLLIQNIYDLEKRESLFLFDREDEARTLHRNVSMYLPDGTASHPKR
jgi:hypothetical protein